MFGVDNPQEIKMTKIFNARYSIVIKKALGVTGKLNRAAVHLQRAAQATCAHHKPYHCPSRKRVVVNTTYRSEFPSAQQAGGALRTPPALPLRPRSQRRGRSCSRRRAVHSEKSASEPSGAKQPARQNFPSQLLLRREERQERDEKAKRSESRTPWTALVVRARNEKCASKFWPRKENSAACRIRRETADAPRSQA